MATWSRVFEESRRIEISSDEQVADFLGGTKEEGGMGLSVSRHCWPRLWPCCREQLVRLRVL